MRWKPVGVKCCNANETEESSETAHAQVMSYPASALLSWLLLCLVLHCHILSVHFAGTQNKT